MAMEKVKCPLKPIMYVRKMYHGQDEQHRVDDFGGCTKDCAWAIVENIADDYEIVTCAIMRMAMGRE